MDDSVQQVILLKYFQCCCVVVVIVAVAIDVVVVVIVVAVVIVIAVAIAVVVVIVVVVVLLLLLLLSRSKQSLPVYPLVHRVLEKVINLLLSLFAINTPSLLAREKLLWHYLLQELLVLPSSVFPLRKIPHSHLL